ncbi:MAG: ACP S-malonyltransferase [Pseudomonadota bacterium]
MTSRVLIFPGQGSQAVGMLADLAQSEAEVVDTFNEASDVLERDCWQLVSQGPESELNQTEWTQPMMLAADIAVWRVYRRLGGAMPTAMAGHSLGEYAALVAADVMNLSDAIRIVHLRGRLMQQAVPTEVGAMAAILGLEDTQVEQLCVEVSDQSQARTVVAANYNAPGQLVIAGHAAAVEQAIEACKAAGARRALRLPVSVPSHSPLMQPAVEPLLEALNAVEIREPKVSLLHNFDVASHAEPQAIKQALAEQLTHPVRWTETINQLLGQGASEFYECGPGRVLCGLGKRIDRSATWQPLENLAALQAAAA